MKSFRSCYNLLFSSLLAVTLFVFSACDVMVGGSVIENIQSELKTTYTFFDQAPDPTTTTASDPTTSDPTATADTGSGDSTSGKVTTTANSTTANSAKNNASSRGTTENIQKKELSYSIGKTYTTENFPKFDRTGQQTKGWRYYKNPLSGATVCPSNFTLDSNSYIVRFTATPQPAYILADWEAASYTIKFYSKIGDDGEVVDEKSASHGETVEESTWYQNYERQGYTFKGWYTSSDGKTLSESPYNFSTPVTSNLKIYAGWTPIKYKIYYKEADESDVENWAEGFTPVTEYTIEDTVSLPDSKKLNKPGFGFMGWYDDSSFTGERRNEINLGSTGDRYFYANWMEGAVEYSVRYFKQCLESINYENKVFHDGSYYYEVDSVTENGITGETTTALEKTYEGFNLHDGDIASYQKIIMGDGSTVVDIYYDRKSIDYKFYSCGGLFADGTDLQVRSGVFEQEFDASEFEYSEDNVGVIREHYIFKGWTLSPDCEDEDKKVDLPTTFDLSHGSFYAIWEAEPLPRYEVEFVTEYGEAPFKRELESGETLNESQAEMDDIISSNGTGYLFLGWYRAYDEAGISLYENAYDFSQPVEENFKLYAKWARAYKVTYIGRDGKTVLGTEMVIENKAVSGPEGFDGEDGDYRFDGWYINSSLTEPYGGYATAPVTLYSKWSLAIKVTYHSNFGTDVSACVNYSRNVDFKPCHILTLASIWDEFNWIRDDGYYFMGWATSPSAVSPEYSSGETYPSLSDDIVLYAVYKSDYKTVTFHNPYVTSEKYEIKLAKGATVNLPDLCLIATNYVSANFTYPDGFKFYGNYADGNGNSIEESFTANSDLELYVCWHCVLIPHFNDGSANSSVDYCYGRDITFTGRDDAERTGYDFVNWYIDEDCTVPCNFEFGSINLTGFMSESELHVYAGWKKHKYTVKFIDSADGSNSEIYDRQLIEYEDKVVRPENPERTGKTFGFWRSETDDYDKPYNFNSPVTEDLTLYVVWNDVKFTVTFESMGGNSVASQEIIYGEKATLPDAPTQAGKNFDGWFTSTNGGTTLSSESFDFENTEIYSDTTLYAKWTNIYKITYLDKDGKLLSEKEVLAGECAGNPEGFIEYDGDYHFEGWFTDSACTEAFDVMDPDVLTGSITLYSKWGRSRKLTFYRNELDDNPKICYVAYNDEFSLLTGTWAFGYDEESTSFFKGWSLTPGTTTVQYQAGYLLENITEDFCFYAVWTSDYKTVTIVNSFDTSEIKTYHLATGSNFKLGELGVWDFKSPDGYTVANASETEGALSGDVDTYHYITLNEDKTYYCLYEKVINAYSNYNGEGENGSETPAKFRYAYGETLSSLNTRLSDESNLPTYEHYDFNGWFTNKGCSQALSISGSSCNIAGFESESEHRIYAGWKKHMYTVNFDNIEAGTQVSSIVEYGDKVEEPEEPTREGYDFAGWYTEQNEPFNFNTAIEEDVTLHANWIEGDSTYEVHHLLESLSDPTKFNEDEDSRETGVSGKTGNTTDAKQKSFTGFTARTPIEQKTIAADGSTVVEIFYERKNYTLTYISNVSDGESVVVPAAIEPYYENTVNLDFTVGERVGYTFAGWNTKADGGGDAYTETGTNTLVMDACDLDLYAQWTLVPHSITYQLNGGSWITGYTPQSTFTVEDSVTLPYTDKFTYGENIFEGWFDNPEFEGEPKAFVPAGTAVDKTYYAKWNSPITVNITFPDYPQMTLTPTEETDFYSRKQLRITLEGSDWKTNTIKWKVDGTEITTSLSSNDIYKASNKALILRYSSNSFCTGYYDVYVEATNNSGQTISGFMQVEIIK